MELIRKAGETRCMGRNRRKSYVTLSEKMKQKEAQFKTPESLVLIRTPYQLVAVMHQVVVWQPPIKK